MGYATRKDKQHGLGDSTKLSSPMDDDDDDDDEEEEQEGNEMDDTGCNSDRHSHLNRHVEHTKLRTTSTTSFKFKAKIKGDEEEEARVQVRGL